VIVGLYVVIGEIYSIYDVLFRREPQLIVGLKHIAIPGGLAKEILRYFANVFD